MKFVNNECKSITNYKVKQAKPREHPKDMIELSFLGAIVGSRGTGKTNVLINLIKEYETTQSFDKVYIFSPTMGNEPKYRLIEEGKYELVSYDNYTNELFAEVVEEINADIDSYKEYQKELKVYCDFKNGKSINSMGMGLISLSQREFEPPEKPKYWKQMPTSLIVFDDLYGNKELYSTNAKNPMSKFAILHRHKLTSMLFLVQGFHNGIPRQLRSNLSMVILFAQKNQKLKEEIATELLGSYITKEQFIEMWDTATQEQHNFFMINFDEKDKNKKFRQNFDKFIQID